MALYPRLINDLIETYAQYKALPNTINYHVVSAELSTVTVTENEDDNYNDEYEYKDVLSLSTTSVIHFFVSGIVNFYFHTNRMSVYVLYAQEFNPTKLQLSILLYSFSFWNGFAYLLYTSLANHYGYDRILIILMILQCIAVLLESITTSFYVLFLGVMIGQLPIPGVVLAYIAWILPHEHAVTYTAAFYASFMVSYLLGPVSAGFVSFYLSNRMVFIINFVICVCTLIHGLIFVSKTQRSLESKQLSLGLLEEKESDEQFAICLDRFGDIDDDDDEDADEKWYSIPNMPIYQWFMLISIIFVHSTVPITEVLLLLYCFMVIADLGGNSLIASANLLTLSVAFIIGNLIAPKIQHLCNKYYIVIVCLIYLIFQIMWVYPNYPSISLFFVYHCICGLAIGILAMISEIILLEIQPTKYSGKVAGGKGLIRNILQASALFMTGFYWDITHNALFYVSGTFFIIGLFISISMLCVKFKFQHI